MKEWLAFIAEGAITIIHAMALVIIIIGTIEAFYRSIGVFFSPSRTGRPFYDAYMRYARWLVGGLTFQLAADIIESTLAPTWDEIGRLGAIAVIRTFLNYFLERDLKELEDREMESSREEIRSRHEDRS
jgi:uncharacterized membrane protein